MTKSEEKAEARQKENWTRWNKAIKAEAKAAAKELGLTGENYMAEMRTIREWRDKRAGFAYELHDAAKIAEKLAEHAPEAPPELLREVRRLAKKLRIATGELQHYVSYVGHELDKEHGRLINRWADAEADRRKGVNRGDVC